MRKQATKFFSVQKKEVNIMKKVQKFLSFLIMSIILMGIPIPVLAIGVHDEPEWKTDIENFFKEVKKSSEFKYIEELADLVPGGHFMDVAILFALLMILLFTVDIFGAFKKKHIYFEEKFFKYPSFFPFLSMLYKYKMNPGKQEDAFMKASQSIGERGDLFLEPLVISSKEVIADGDIHIKGKSIAMFSVENGTPAVFYWLGAIIGIIASGIINPSGQAEYFFLIVFLCTIFIALVISNTFPTIKSTLILNNGIKITTFSPYKKDLIEKIIIALKQVQYSD